MSVALVLRAIDALTWQYGSPRMAGDMIRENQLVLQRQVL
jgi:hypothetical protein